MARLAGRGSGRRARFVVTGDLPSGAWYCSNCGEVLATSISGVPDEANFRRDLVLMPSERDGYRVLGLPARIRLRGKKPRGCRTARLMPRTISDRHDELPAAQRMQWHGPWKLPLLAYCPRPGICGVLQIVDLTAMIDSSNKTPDPE